MMDVRIAGADIMMRDAVLRGTATAGGTDAKLVDTKKSVVADMFKGYYIAMEIEGVEYIRVLGNHTADEFKFSDGLPLGTAATAIIGESTAPQVTVEADDVGAFANAYTVVYVADTEEAGVTEAEFKDGIILVTLALDTSAASNTTIGSGGDGTVTVTVKKKGKEGNDYTIAVVIPDEEEALLSATLTGNDLVVSLATDDQKQPDDTENTAGAVATEIAKIEVFTATASGAGTTPIDTAVTKKSFANGHTAEIVATGTAVASAIDALSGFSALMTGVNGVVAPTAKPVGFSGGVDTIVAKEGSRYSVFNIKDLSS